MECRICGDPVVLATSKRATVCQIKQVQFYEGLCERHARALSSRMLSTDDFNDFVYAVDESRLTALDTVRSFNERRRLQD